MNKVINEFKSSLISGKLGGKTVPTEHDINHFRDTHSLELPGDLLEYFKTINGTGSKYDDNFFQFYSLKDFKSIEELYIDWAGIPDFKAIKNTLPDYQNFYVIADYSINLIAYCIRLLPTQLGENEIFAICGGSYARVAGSFTEFIQLYLSDVSYLITSI